MSYYQLLGVDREPFSTSPDPAFFYPSRVHSAVLNRLQIAIELKRGLSIVVGEIGTGKTTLARRLCQILCEDPNIDMHIILNPLNLSDDAFLRKLLSIFHLNVELSSDPVDCLSAIERYLFEKGVEEQKTVVLLIDEAQQLSSSALEILRVLLNYETNEHKLLQLVLVGQKELVPKLREIPNFWDRINLKTQITPLDEKEMREMVEYRLSQANLKEDQILFRSDALRLIYKKTKGFPRKVTLLCHDALQYLVMMNKEWVDKRVIKEVSRPQSLVGC